MTDIVLQRSGTAVLVTTTLEDPNEGVRSRHAMNDRKLYSWVLTSDHQAVLRAVPEGRGVVSVIASPRGTFIQLNRRYANPASSSLLYSADTTPLAFVDVSFVPFSDEEDMRRYHFYAPLTLAPNVTVRSIEAIYMDSITHSLFMVSSPIREMGLAAIPYFWKLTAEENIGHGSYALEGVDGDVWFCPSIVHDNVRYVLHGGLRGSQFISFTSFRGETGTTTGGSHFMGLNSSNSDFQVTSIEALSHVFGDASGIFVVTNDGLFYRRGL
jgi:hypothetical protein